MVTTFNDTRAATFRKYVVEQGLPKSIWLKTSRTLTSQFSVFALEKQSEKLSFQSLFKSNKSFGG